MDADARELLELLDLQSTGDGLFVGVPPFENRMRVFGGHVLAQALAAACFTVDGRPCHGLHACFLRPGKPGRPTDYEVSAMRDGESFATRKVVAVQRDEVNLELIASFQRDEPAGAQYALGMPDVPPPESFPNEDERNRELLNQAPEELHPLITRRRPIELIRVDARDLRDRTPTQGPVRTWLRARGRLFDDANLQRCALAYASDMIALEPSLRAVGASVVDTELQVASLDHALWFHRPFRCDDWLLCVLEASSVAHGRGFNRGSIFDRSGQLIASLAQECVVRTRRAESSV